MLGTLKRLSSMGAIRIINRRIANIRTGLCIGSVNSLNDMERKSIIFISFCVPNYIWEAQLADFRTKIYKIF
jgi:hypothetical protein